MEFKRNVESSLLTYAIETLEMSDAESQRQEKQSGGVHEDEVIVNDWFSRTNV